MVIIYVLSIIINFSKKSYIFINSIVVICFSQKTFTYG